MGIFPLLALDTTYVAPINMILSFTSGSLRSFDPWVVPPLEDVDKYGASIPLTIVELVDMKIPSASSDTGQHFHSHMDCDQPTFPIRVFDSLNSHDFLDTNLPSKEAILEVMASIENPKDEVMH
jgi:hypothetical protein